MVETHVAAAAESPLAARADRLARAADPDQLRLREIPFTTQVDLRVDPKSTAAERIGTAIGVMLPNQPGEVASTAELAVLWLGPDEWLVVGPEDASERLRAVLGEALGDDVGAIADVSCQRAVVEVSGPCARDVLSKACAVDLHPRSFGAGTCAQTLLARAQVVLVRWDGGTPRFWVMVRSSFARYVADWLVDAAREHRAVLDHRPAGEPRTDGEPGNAGQPGTAGQPRTDGESGNAGQPGTAGQPRTARESGNAGQPGTAREPRTAGQHRGEQP